MRDADYAKNMESAQKEYLVVKIAKNTNQKHNIPPALKSRGFFIFTKNNVVNLCNMYAKMQNLCKCILFAYQMQCLCNAIKLY